MNRPGLGLGSPTSGSRLGRTSKTNRPRPLLTCSSKLMAWLTQHVEAADTTQPRAQDADRSYSCPMNGKRRSSATRLATSSGPRGGNWRRRFGGTLAGVIVYAPSLAAKLFPHEWRWPGGFSLDYGALLVALPGVVLIVLLAPRVAYRRRDALLLFLPPWGLRIAWVIGTRLVQLPHRDWPERTDTFPVHGRHAARIAAAAHSYRSWRQRRVRIANPAQQEPSDC